MRVCPGQLVVNWDELWIQFDGMFERLPRLRPIPLRPIHLAQFIKRIGRLWLQSGSLFQSSDCLPFAADAAG